MLQIERTDPLSHRERARVRGVNKAFCFLDPLIPTFSRREKGLPSVWLKHLANQVTLYIHEPDNATLLHRR